MVPDMRLKITVLTLLVLSLAGSAVAADLTLNPDTGELVVSGNPILTRNGDRQVTGPPFSPLYLAVINFYGTVASCQVKTGWQIGLSASGNAYATVAIASPPTVTTTQGTFSAVQSGQTATLQGYAAGNQFSVADDHGTPQCVNLGTSLDPGTGQFLRLLDTAPPPPPTAEEIRSLVGDGDPPIPILVGSLKMVATGKTEFACSGNPTQKATLKKVPGLATLSLGAANIYPPVVYLNLAGVSDWKVTAYPQQVEIRPSKWWETTGLTISVSGDNKVQCSDDHKSLTLVQNSAEKPQEFVVDWSTGLFESRRTITVPCGSSTSTSGCWLLLGPPKKK
jgi:hypothetical protein